MKCPVCATEMDEHARHGVKIDHCPACGGVWLDRGELDHLIAAVRPPLTLQDPDPPRPAPPRRNPEAPRGEHYAKKKTPNPVRFEDRGREKSGKPGASLRYSRRYSRKALLKDVLDEIFDFD